jgi:hypothetical protein
MHGVRVFLATTLIAAAAVAEDQVNYARIDYSKAATHEADVEEMSITGMHAPSASATRAAWLCVQRGCRPV